MDTLLNWIYEVFSSKAALPEISVIGLVGVVVTYYGDRHKRTEYRNSHLLEIRKARYDLIMSKVRDSVNVANTSVENLIETMARVKSGGVRIKYAQADLEFADFYEFSQDSATSSPFAQLLGSTASVVTSMHICINIVAEIFDPFKSITDPDKRLFAHHIPDSFIEEWTGKLRLFQKAMNTSTNLIERQYRKEVARLMPRDTVLHRIQDLRQAKRNQVVIHQILKSDPSSFLDKEKSSEPTR